MRYDRTLAITRRHEQLLALVRKGGYSSEKLARELSVSEQTVYRDIRCLKEQGHPIEAIRNRDCWAYQLALDGSKGHRRNGRRSG